MKVEYRGKKWKAKPNGDEYLFLTRWFGLVSTVAHYTEVTPC